MNNLGLVFDNRYLHHTIPQSSPENPNRLRSLYVHLQQKLIQDCFTHITPRDATDAEIQSAHSSFYLEQLREHSIKDDPYSYDKDTYLMEESLPAARLAAGGCFCLADRIMEGDIDYGFGLIRPPGHHATPGRGMGFCIFNNVALTANHLRKTYGLKRILIIDFDVHHANGTQDVFYDDKEVMVLSIHQKGIFPFTGLSEEVGEKEGKGYTINIPVHPQFANAEYTCLLGKILQGVVEQFMPQFILVSAGFDAHIDDSISGTDLTSDWFGIITHILRKHAADSCDGKLLYILEGGYNPESLEESIFAVIDVLLQDKFIRPGILSVPRAEKLLEGHPIRDYWTI